MLPLISAAVITLFTRRAKTLSAFISVAAVLGSFICSCLIFAQSDISASGHNWIDIHGVFTVPIGFVLDPLSKMMLVVVTGVGGLIHLAGELFKSLAGIDMLSVHYRGVGQALPDLLSGRVDVMFFPLVGVLSTIKAGKLRALGVTTPTRRSVVTDVPPIGDFVKGYEGTDWTGIGGAAGIPLDVIATLNLNGDYVSDALAAQVGGIGIAPGANMSDSVAMFEATHGTAPKYAGKDYVNPGSEILSAEMMLRHMGWTEAADIIIKSMEASILGKRVTYDFARQMEGATQVSCSGFGQVLVENM